MATTHPEPTPKRPNIAIVAGGNSSEVGVSMKSAAGILSFIDQTKFNCFVVTIIGKEWLVHLSPTEQYPIDKNNFSFLKDGKQTVFDFAYITIHGTPGEDGLLQGYLELMQIPYSSCGVLASALTFSKFFCNKYLKTFGIETANAILLRQGNEITDREILNTIGLPCFVKPNLGGSSFGITKVKTAADIQPAIRKAFQEAPEVIIESFVEGKEFTCGIYQTDNKKTILPITEVISQNEFFDYAAKYERKSDEITPARIPETLANRIQHLTAEIYTILNCKGIVRADYIVTPDGKINLLEVNTTPGMTETSFIPQQIAAAGLDIKAVMTDIITNGINSFKK